MELAPWLRQSIVIGFLVGLILMTLGYLYISNLSRSPNAVTLIWSSLTSLVGKDTRSSYGMLALVLTTWIIGCVLQVAEANLHLADGRDKSVNSGVWVRMILVALGVSILVALFFWLWHAGGLAALNRSAASTIDQVMAQVRSSEHILTRYYVYLLFLVFILGMFVPSSWPGPAFRWQAFSLATAVAVVPGGFWHRRVYQSACHPGRHLLQNSRIVCPPGKLAGGDRNLRPGSRPGPQ